MWNERYAGETYFYGKEPNDFLKDNIQLIKPGHQVLCLAEGEGRNAVFIASAISSAHVVAVDSSSVGLEKTRQLAVEKHVVVQTVCADLNDYDLGIAQWDVLVSIWCHVPSELRKRIHASALHALKPGGCLILEAYTPTQLKYSTGGPKSEDLLMTLSSLRDELHGLEITVEQELERNVIEGQGHTGMSAVVQLIAKKP